MGDWRPGSRRGLLLALPALAAGRVAFGHGTRLGALVIDHPYAVPSSGADGAVHFRQLLNSGGGADRLLEARTPVAAAVHIQRRDGTGAWRVLPALDLAAGAAPKMRHDGDTRLALAGLKAPLRVGDRFALWLRFEQAGEREVSVWVQQPRTAAPSHPH